MSVESCIGRMVEEKKISRRMAAEALGIYRGFQGRLGRDMGEASADSAAALKVAEILEKSARQKKLQVAKQAIAFAKADERAAAHPKGRLQGTMSLLVRDLFGHGGENVESKTEAVLGDLMGKFYVAQEAFRGKILGLRTAGDRQGIDRMVDEIFGVDSKDATAKEAARQWNATTDAAVTRAQAAGKIFQSLDEWRLPQSWESYRVKKVGAEVFKSDLRAALQSGGLKLWDDEAGDFVTSPVRQEEILDRAYKDIVLDMTRGARGFDSRARTFRFQDGPAGAAAYKGLMKKYGPGEDLFGQMIGHIRGMSREIAFSELLGPQYGASFRALLQKAAEQEKLEPSKLNLGEKIALKSTGQASASAVQRTFDYLAGRANAVENEVFAGVMGGLRNLLRSAQLSKAVLSAVPGDLVTAGLTSTFNGIPAARVVARAAAIVANDAKARQLGARLGIVAHAAIDGVGALRRFDDEYATVGNFDRVASTLSAATIRLSGMEIETQALRRAFQMEFMAHIAEQSGTSFGRIEGPFKRFLDRYGFTAADWDAIRAAPKLEVDGARFFLPSAVENRELADRMVGAILDERQFAVLEPSARTSQLNAIGGKRGTFWGEMIRSPLMYKSFPVQMVLTHMMRASQVSGMANKATYWASLLGLTTMAGALTLQAKALVSGEDPRSMKSLSFWWQAMATGGALGYYSDILHAGLMSDPVKAVASFTGPVGEIASQALGAFPPIRHAVQGERGKTFGAWLADFARYNLPSAPWYTRLAFDRLLFDQFQMAIDPNYRHSFYRMQQQARKNFDTQFWWAPGTSEPQRAPNMGNAVAAPRP